MRERVERSGAFAADVRPRAYVVGVDGFRPVGPHAPEGLGRPAGRPRVRVGQGPAEVLEDRDGRRPELAQPPDGVAADVLIGVVEHPREGGDGVRADLSDGGVPVATE